MTRQHKTTQTRQDNTDKERQDKTRHDWSKKETGYRVVINPPPPLAPPVTFVFCFVSQPNFLLLEESLSLLSYWFVFSVVVFLCFLFVFVFLLCVFLCCHFVFVNNLSCHLLLSLQSCAELLEAALLELETKTDEMGRMAQQLRLADRYVPP